MRDILKLLAIGLALWGCEPGAEPDLASLRVSELDTLITTEAGVIGMPVDLVFTPAGEVAVADFLAQRIVLVDPTGRVTTLGGPGDGPGEFSGVWGLQISGPDLLVIDRGNGRIQQIATDGTYIDSWPVTPRVGVSLPFLLPDGGVVYGSMGRDSTLAVVVDREGRETRIGRAVAAPSPVRSFTRIREAIDRGEIPEDLRHDAIVAARLDGTVWVGLQADGVLHRYRPDGSLAWTVPIRVPEMDTVLEQFFVRNRSEEQPNRYYPLYYFADLWPMDEELWVLMTTVEDGPAALILVLDEHGGTKQRIDVPGAGGANSFAVGSSGEVVALSTYHDAQILRATLPRAPR